MSFPDQLYIYDDLKSETVSLQTLTAQRHINVSPGRKTTTAEHKGNSEL